MIEKLGFLHPILTRCSPPYPPVWGQGVGPGHIQLGAAPAVEDLLQQLDTVRNASVDTMPGALVANGGWMRALEFLLPLAQSAAPPHP